jgi:hypothetical protein
MRLSVRLLCLTLLWLPFIARAQDPRQATCAAYVADFQGRDSGRRLALENWVLGYVAGFHAALGGHQLEGVDEAKLLRNLAGNCHARPELNLAVAVTMAAGAVR